MKVPLGRRVLIGAFGDMRIDNFPTQPIAAPEDFTGKNQLFVTCFMKS